MKTILKMKALNFNIKKSVLLILSALVMGIAYPQQWQLLQTGVTSTLNDVCCVDEETIYVCGGNGVILKTTSGGASWEEVYRNTGTDWFNIQFIDSNTGFVVGRNSNGNGRLMKTEDGGVTWLDKDYAFDLFTPYVTDYFESDLFMVDADTLYVAFYKLLKSTDGGETFSIIDDVDLQSFLFPVYLYFEDNIGYIINGYAATEIPTILQVFKTEDYGVNWDLVCVDNMTTITGAYDVPVSHFIDKDHVNIYGGVREYGNVYFDLLWTENGFSSFSYGYAGLISNYGVELVNGRFTNSQNGMLIFHSGYGYYTSPFSASTHDGGMSWKFIDEGFDPLYPLTSIDGFDTTYYAVGQCGVVYKWGKQATQETYEVQSIVNLFPNPASGSVTVTGESLRKVEIHNLLGQLVASSNCNGDSVTIDLQSLPQGVYLVTATDREGKKHVRKLAVGD